MNNRSENNKPTSDYDFAEIKPDRLSSNTISKGKYCKDYAETGFCPFGNSCIFAHERAKSASSDWKKINPWNQRDNKRNLSPQNDNLKCVCCNRSFLHYFFPSCNHRYCYECLNIPICPVCGLKTNGTFNEQFQ